METITIEIRSEVGGWLSASGEVFRCYRDGLPCYIGAETRQEAEQRAKEHFFPRKVVFMESAQERSNRLLSEMKIEAKQRLMDKLKAFKEAALELQEAWEKAGCDAPWEDLLVESYPFPNDFDQVVYAIMTWEDRQKELNKSP